MKPSEEIKQFASAYDNTLLRSGPTKQLRDIASFMNVLERMLADVHTAWETGELSCDVLNGRWYRFLSEYKKLNELGLI